MKGFDGGLMFEMVNFVMINLFVKFNYYIVIVYKYCVYSICDCNYVFKNNF